MHMLLALIILGVLALGAIGSIVLYRHLNKKVYTGRCGNEFYDPVFHEGLDTSQAQARTSRSQVLNDYVDEDITVCPEEKYEEIHTPAFDEVRETFIVHDFVSNYTAIIDHEARRCLVRTIRQDIVGPNAFVLQIEEKTPFGLRVSTTVVRQDAIIKTWNYPRPYGKRIAEACFRYDFFTLELYFHGMKKRSPTRRSQKAALGKPVGTYAVFTNNATHQTLYKIRVFEPVASVKPVALP
ncbi:hypothetical protein EGW08_010412 [Elysia chlorotica]|uniref:Integral membrane protein 2 n=1 Tax=Elysia chlorotica TaxID=188477 RepID=A0A3S1B7S6_ELYCH|nr:hypothetical protein EGW08_010412 [Elysia chlorotica]